MASAFWRTVLRFDATKIDSAIGLRNAIGIVLPLIVGSALGYTSAGVVASLGALNVCYSDSRDPYAARARRMLLASVLVAIAVVVGALSAVDNTVAVVASILWAFGTGMFVVLGNRAGDLSTVTLVTLLVFAARSLTPLEALQSGLLAFAGGALQTLLSVAFWPVNPWQPERRTIASVYRTLAEIAVSPAGPGSAPPATGPMIDAQETGASLAQRKLTQDRSAEPERLSFLLNQAERIRLSLLSLRRLRQRVSRDPEGKDLLAALDRMLELSSNILESVSQSVEEGHGVPRLGGLNNVVSEVRSLHQNEARHQVDALAGQLRAASGLTTPEQSRATVHSPKQDPLSRLRRLRANLSFESTAFRHAVRLAACVGLGDALGRAFVQRGYWLPMTIAIVLKPDFTATFSRGILRIAGTLIGLLLATGLFHVLHLGPATDIALVMAFALILRWAGPANYGIFVIGISGIAVLLIAITGVAPNEAIAARAVNTILGGALALAAYWVWPTWERPLTGPVIGKMLEAYRDYFGQVMKAHCGDSPANPDPARLAARLARSNAEASATRFASEPGVQPAEVELLNAILVSTHTFIRAVMALESGIYHTPISHTPMTSQPPPRLSAFCTDVETTLAALANSLAQRTPVPENLPDLREAWETMNENPGNTLFETETDRLTTSLNTLKEQIARWSGHA